MVPHVNFSTMDTMGTLALCLLESPKYASLVQGQTHVILTINDTKRDIMSATLHLTSRRINFWRSPRNTQNFSDVFAGTGVQKMKNL